MLLTKLYFKNAVITTATRNPMNTKPAVGKKCYKFGKNHMYGRYIFITDTSDFLISENER